MADMRVRTGRLPACGLVAAFLLAGLAGCVSSPTPDQMSRTKVETAPADLQLLCADTVAKAGNVDSSKVLPLSSSKLDSKTYQVELNAAGKRTSCIIDQDGKVASVQPS